MRVVELNPYDHWITYVDADGYWQDTNTLPVDEWICSTCPTSVGYVTRDTAESTTLDWRMTYIPIGSDPTLPEAIRYCEDCKQDHEEVEA